MSSYTSQSSHLFLHFFAFITPPPQPSPYFSSVTSSHLTTSISDLSAEMPEKLKLSFSQETSLCLPSLLSFYSSIILDCFSHLTPGTTQSQKGRNISSNSVQRSSESLSQTENKFKSE